MKVIVCLGNPGEKYRHTRHNVGFMFGDALVEKYSLNKRGEKWKSIVYEGSIDGESVLVVFPQTFMNLSGDAVLAVLSFYKLPLQSLLVVYDDVDLPFGAVRYREKGSGGTHNGMRDIVAKLGTDIPRLRLGVGRPAAGMDLSRYVLGDFLAEERKGVEEMIGKGIVEIGRVFGL